MVGNTDDTNAGGLEDIAAAAEEGAVEEVEGTGEDTFADGAV